MANKQPLVSVIIPVYKVEKYLAQCVDSVRNQIYPNLEIILVEDGSPDDCAAMCDAYAAQDKRIRVIHQENCGVAKARNAGIQCATGQYLFFVDSDDVLMHHAIQILIDVALQYEADMVCADYQEIEESDSGTTVAETAVKPIVNCMDTEQALKYYTPKEWGPWNRLIRATVHEGIYFPDYRIHEDEAIKFLLLERCKKVAQIDTVTYCYRQRHNSITGTSSRTDRMDMFYSRRENLTYLEEYHPALVSDFLPKVCEDALLNLDLLIRDNNAPMNRIDEIIAFFRTNSGRLLKSAQVTKSQKLRCLLILCSNWNRKKNLYIKFYTSLGKI